jgi:hypothetical protein
MKTDETKNKKPIGVKDAIDQLKRLTQLVDDAAETKMEKQAETIQQLESCGEVFKFTQYKFRVVCQAAMGMMLDAGEVFWGCDFWGALKEEKQILDRDVMDYHIHDDVINDNRHTNAVSELVDAIDEWPTEQIISLSRHLANTEFIDKLGLQVA